MWLDNGISLKPSLFLKEDSHGSLVCGRPSGEWLRLLLLLLPTSSLQVGLSGARMLVSG